MGFFNDLKEDLSQAVGEVMDDGFDLEATAAVQDSATPETTDELSRMLESINLEELGAVSEEEPAETIVEETVEEPKPAPYVLPEAEEPPVQHVPVWDNKPEDNNGVLDETALVSGGMKIVGDVSTRGSLDVIGSITGNVEVLGKLNISGAIEGNSVAADVYADGARVTGDIRSTGSLKVGQDTIIIGNVYATSAVIAGAVKGDIDVKGPVILDTSAIVMGNIKSKSVQINNGAVIEGLCSQCYADVSPTSFFDEVKKARQ